MSVLVVLAQNIPEGSLMHPMINLPEDLNQPCTIRLVDVPDDALFTPLFDGSFCFTAPPGVYTIKFLVFVGGMRRGGVHTRTLRIRNDENG